MPPLTLPDTTEIRLLGLCSCGHTIKDCPGGQHVGSGHLGVILINPHFGPPLLLISGMRSSYWTRKALKTCSYWQEVPLAIEALGWRILTEPLDT